MMDKQLLPFLFSYTSLWISWNTGNTSNISISICTGINFRHLFEVCVHGFHLMYFDITAAQHSVMFLSQTTLCGRELFSSRISTHVNL